MMDMDIAACLSRRQAVLNAIGNGIAIIPTAPLRVRSRDTTFPYRPDSYFWYLSGFPEPEAVIVLLGGSAPRSLLFCREKNEEREIWEGFYYGPEKACTTFMFDEAYGISTLFSKLPELIANRESLWCSLGLDSLWDRELLGALEKVRAQGRAGQRAPDVIHDIRAVLDPMRQIKMADELSLMRRAADISSAAHRRAMQVCAPQMPEYVLEAEISHEFRIQGASGHAYSPIVAGGVNACVLHYIENDRPLAADALVLIDAGCELMGYAADITRTFPVNGRFSGAQAAVYDIVLSAQYAAIDAIGPDRNFLAFHEAALRVLVQGLVDLKLLSGTIDGLIEEEAYKPFYMHRTGHWLGLDVHDVGAYRAGEQWLKLMPGMVLTVEPGLYLRPGKGVPSALEGIGIRIEDNVLVTETGAEVYTHAPKTIRDIEEVMRAQR